MITVALTGGIGCGKTTVCQLFAELGTPIIDTDIIARELVQPGNDALEEIKSYFGNEVLLADGSLNRKSLASKTFSNPDHRKKLESILHPKIRLSVEKKVQSLTAPYVIIAIPLLIETSQQNTYDQILVVDCDEHQQIQRAHKRDQRSIEEIKNIMSSQVSRQQRLSHANDLINNETDIESLRLQVSTLHKKYINLANNNNL